MTSLCLFQSKSIEPEVIVHWSRSFLKSGQPWADATASRRRRGHQSKMFSSLHFTLSLASQRGERTWRNERDRSLIMRQTLESTQNWESPRASSTNCSDGSCEWAKRWRWHLMVWAREWEIFREHVAFQFDFGAQTWRKRIDAAIGWEKWVFYGIRIRALFILRFTNKIFFVAIVLPQNANPADTSRFQVIHNRIPCRCSKTVMNVCRWKGTDALDIDRLSSDGKLWQFEWKKEIYNWGRW